MFALVTVCASVARGQTPTHVQYKTNDATNPSAQFDNTTVAANSYYAICSVNLNTGTCNTPTDTEGNTFSLILGPTNTNANNRVTQYAWKVASVVGGTRDTISVTTSTTASFVIVECSSCSFFDSGTQRGQGAGGSADVADSGSVSTTVAAELVYGVGGTNTGDNGFQSYGSGYTGVVIGSQVLEYKNVSSTGSYSATATLGNGTYGVMAILPLALSGGGGGGGGTGPLQSPGPLQSAGPKQTAGPLQPPKIH